MYETIRIVEKLRPKYVLWENVKNILSIKHRHNFDKYIEVLNELGYNSYFQVLNAKDYGIPQNRERVFTVSIRKDIDDGKFEFPEKQELKLKLKDMLEENVDEKYYLSEKMMRYVSSNNEKWTGNNDKSLINKNIASAINTGEGHRRCDASNYVSNEFSENTDIKEVVRKYGIFDNERAKHQAGSVYDENGLSPTLDTMQGGWRQPCIEEKLYIKNATKKGYIEAHEGDGINISGRMKYQRGNVQEAMIQTITTNGGYDRGVVVPSLKEKLCDYLVKNSLVKENDVIRHSYSTSRMKKMYTQNSSNNNTAPTLDTRCDCLGVTVNGGEINGLRIRKLTPKECWRLMGFNDEDFDKASKQNSNAQLYKQARK